MFGLHCGASYKSASLRAGMLVVLAALGSAIGTPAAAQNRAPPERLLEPTDDRCLVFAVDDAEGEPQQLRARCQDRVLFLGAATSFEAVINEELKATLVDVRFQDERRIYLLTLQADGHPLLEELTGQIALAAGRGPMSAIDGVDLELKGFADNGEVAVRPALDRASTSTERIGLREQVALERTRRQTASRN